MKGKPSPSPATPGSQGFIFPCLRQTSESEDNRLRNVSCLSVSFKASLITPRLPEDLAAHMYKTVYCCQRVK